MGKVVFTANLRRHVACPPAYCGGGTVRQVLDNVFAANPPLRGYVVDEQGRLRRHVNVFINDRPVTDRIGLSDEVGPADDVFVFQALSGG